MEHDPLSAFRYVFIVLFFVTLVAGGYLIKNSGRIFGTDPMVPTENRSARAYAKMAVFAIWVHVLILTGGFALWLH